MCNLTFRSSFVCLTLCHGQPVFLPLGFSDFPSQRAIMAKHCHTQFRNFSGKQPKNEVFDVFANVLLSLFA